MHEQDDGGTDADALLDAVAASNLVGSASWSWSWPWPWSSLPQCLLTKALVTFVSSLWQGYDFVGLIGNEEPPRPPQRAHAGLTWLTVTENQMAAICTKGANRHCRTTPIYWGTLCFRIETTASTQENTADLTAPLPTAQAPSTVTRPASPRSRPAPVR